jgi:hypothetical protein
MTSRFRRFLDDLNREYGALHAAKEDAFWTSMMGLGDDADADRAAFARHEVAWSSFLQDPARLAAVRAEIAVAEEAVDGPGEPPTEDELVALSGWLATFEAHCIDDEAARELAADIVRREGELASARAGLELGYHDPEQGFVRASSVKLGVMLGAEEDGRLRRAAWDGLRSIEGCVLESGFLDVVRERNRLGRALGAEDYYDWKVKRAEGLSKAQVFELLDDLERRTRDSGRRFVDDLRARHGEDVGPWDVRFLAGGDATREEDPYFPFADAVRRWGRSFAALGVRYRGAKLVLDLVDREGKHENGFMHGPEPSWRDGGEPRRARIQFTANAIPGMVGSGARATATLFHEGGHAAHFASIDMPAPCFGQEFAPTSVALAETQSMLLDSLLDDADWRARYARDASGAALPLETIERSVRSRQPIAAWDVRQMMAVCYAEKAIYELPDEQLDAEHVLDAVRRVERELLFLSDGSPRPVLSVPHLISGEASAYYHGYVLALMAVHQTRAFLLERDGYLVDNAKLGPTLCDAYWTPGNSRGFQDLVEELTGRPLDGDALAARLNRTVDEALASAREEYARGAAQPPPDVPVDLGADVTIAHGHEVVAHLAPGGDFDAFAEAFAGWVTEQAARGG